MLEEKNQNETLITTLKEKVMKEFEICVFWYMRGTYLAC